MQARNRPETFWPTSARARPNMVVISKLNKSLVDPKSCIVLLCVPSKILKRLIYAPVESVIDLLLPHDLTRRDFDTGGRPRIRSPCWRWTATIAFRQRRPELCLSCSQQSMTLHGVPHLQVTAISTWQAHGPHDHGAGWLSQLHAYHQWQQTEQVTAPQEWRPTGIRLGASFVSTSIPLTYLLITISVEAVLSKDMATIDKHLQSSKLKLSTTKTVSAVFHLNNK